MTWRHAGASRVGTAHVATGAPCQDTHRVALLAGPLDERALLVGVADGAGSASHSAIGADLVCARIHDEVQRWLDAGHSIAACTRAVADGWLRMAHLAVVAWAERHDLPPRELASTCVLCVAGADATVCVQVGDGAVVVDDGDGFAPVFWPQRGEYANMTTFLDAEAVEAAEFAVLPRGAERIAVFSDGLQMIALHYASRTAPADFFASLFGFLEAQPAGSSPALDEALGRMLDRKPITDRTDDDRTLVLASRRGG